MTLERFLILSLILLGLCQFSFGTSPSVPTNKTSSFSRTSFPPDFLFGAASSAYQYEGAVNEDGRGPSIWDNFTHEYPEKILDGSNGDIAEDFYHRYKEDIKLMQNTGLDSFRFSISWSRVLPHGKLSKGVSKKGIAFYNNLINALLEKGIKPFVTIFHWDIPQALEDEYGGFLNPKIVGDFRDFADLCFKEFGDRVKYWSTINEALSFSLMSYDKGVFAPGRCSSWMSNNCTGGDSGTEPYLVMHHLLLSHASAVKLYRKKYKDSQKGNIGMVVVSNWILPYSSKSTADAKAAQRVLNFSYGWVLDPLTHGRYPKIMRTFLGKRLPKFSKEQAEILKNSYDFLGLNYYTSNYAKNMPSSNKVNLSYSTDPQAEQTSVNSNGQLIGAPMGFSGLFVYPEGLYHLLVYTKNKYNNPIIYITENGMADAKNVTNAQLIRDTRRVDFHRSHLLAIKKAIKDGVRVEGYFAWSFLDTFEWSSGFTITFGLNFVDYKNGLKRIPKLSARWFKNFLTRT